MRIPSGTTDQVKYFVAVDATDNITRETGLSSFTVARARNGAAAVAMTTPTVTEVSNTLMPGVYALLMDEDMTIAAGNDSEEMVFHVTHTGMREVTLTIELYRPKITEGNTLTVPGTGQAEANVTQWTGVPTTHTSGPDVNVASVSGDSTAADNLEADYDGTGYVKANSTIGTCTANTDMRGTDGALLASNAPTNFADLAITATTGLVSVGTNNDKTGYSISGTLTTLDALENISAADVNTQVNDVMNVDPHSEPTGVPAANASLGTKLGYVFMGVRNRVDVTSTAKTFYDDNGTAEFRKVLSDDGTTYSEAEASNP